MLKPTATKHDTDATNPNQSEKTQNQPPTNPETREPNLDTAATTAQSHITGNDDTCKKRKHEQGPGEITPAEPSEETQSKQTDETWLPKGFPGAQQPGNKKYTQPHMNEQCPYSKKGGNTTTIQCTGIMQPPYQTSMTKQRQTRGIDRFDSDDLRWKQSCDNTQCKKSRSFCKRRKFGCPAHSNTNITKHEELNCDFCTGKYQRSTKKDRAERRAKQQERKKTKRKTTDSPQSTVGLPTNDKLTSEGNLNNYDVTKTMLHTVQDTERTDGNTHSEKHRDKPNSTATDDSEDDADDNKKTKTGTQKKKDTPDATTVKQRNGTDACNVGVEAAGGDAKEAVSEQAFAKKQTAVAQSVVLARQNNKESILAKEMPLQPIPQQQPLGTKPPTQMEQQLKDLQRQRDEIQRQFDEITRENEETKRQVEETRRLISEARRKEEDAREEARRHLEKTRRLEKAITETSQSKQEHTGTQC